jgi:hypothetical protein
MDDAKVDRLARAFNLSGSRRWLVALLSAMIGNLVQRVTRAAQLGPATCGARGAVCTLHSGCCDGLTCATSAINTSYGICVPGDGGMVSTGTSLISPFSETAVEEVTALLPAASTAPATDPRADRKARIAEIRARKDAKSSKRKTRLDTKRSTQQTRKDEKQERRLEAREAVVKPVRPQPPPQLPPQLQLELLFSEADGDSDVVGDPLVQIEIVRATNRDNVNLVLTRIETIQGSVNATDLTTSQFTLSPGNSFSFISGLPTEDVADAANGQYRWLNMIACDETVAGQGYRVKAAFSRDAVNHEFVVLCDGPHITSVVETPAAVAQPPPPPPPQRKKKDKEKRKRHDQHRKKKR